MRALPFVTDELFSVLVLSLVLSLMGCADQVSPIKVGVLHSLSGTMADSERPVAMATQMAIEEINAKGGVLGRPIEPMLFDGQSSDAQFYRLAETLLVSEGVTTVFGCWTSSCRKTVAPLFEQYGALLVYPVQFEGLENSPNILYTGSSASQQILPSVAWGMANLGKRVMLVGSDYIYPRVANSLAKYQVQMLQGEVVDEVYFNLGDNALSGLGESIEAQTPDFILSTLNGSSNEEFFYLLGNLSRQVPVVATSISEEELNRCSVQVPLYVGNSYFERLDGARNEDFVRRFQAYAGDHVAVSAAVEAAYSGVYLWAHAITQSQSHNILEVINHLPSQSIQGPVDKLVIAIDSNYVWRRFYLAQYVPSERGFNVIYREAEALPPNPYPIFRSKLSWNDFIQTMYTQWGEQWRAPEVLLDNP